MYDSGLTCTFHPNSPEGSVFRTYDDYKMLLDNLDNKYIGFAPDSGHIIKGGMNVYDIFRDYIKVVNHVHFKDINANGEWCIMGEGITNFKKIVEILKSNGYNGYVMIEDESSDAEHDPDAVSSKNAQFVLSGITSGRVIL